MYKIMLLDDEPILLDGLARLTSWEKNGFLLVATASNGVEGLAKAQEYEPDAIITDIKMRYMDGFDFIRRIRSAYPEIEVAIISAYDLFEYAQQAIHLGVVNYLLKPVQQEDMSKVLNELKRKLDNKHSVESMLSKAQIYEEWQKEELKALAKKSLVQGNYSYENYQYADISHDDSACSLIVVLLRDNTKCLKSLASIPIEKLMSDIFGKLELFSSVFDDGSVCFVLSDTDQEQAMKLTRNGLRHIEETLHMSLTATIGCKVDKIQQLGISYTSARRQMETANLTGTVGVSSSDTEIGDGYPSNLEYTLLMEVAAGNLDFIQTWGKEFQKFIQENPDSYIPVSRLLFLRVLQRLIRTNRKFFKEYNIWYAKLEKVLSLSPEESPKAYLLLLEQLICSRDGGDGALKSYISQLVDKAICFATDSLKEDSLSIRSAADYLHVSAPYLGRVFKRTTGQSFSDYLNDLRISRAKTMLINPSYTAGYIASELGFCNQSYFQVIFKRKVGTTPGEYRAQLAEQEKES